MPVPKKKKSKSKRDMRRSHDSIKMPNIVTCPQCHEPVLPHHVCLECGTYNGKTIIKTEEK
ncbi:MAG: 50S ribosomal protein L32 [Deltaproteobacteria bacterium]|jgi:large subunit ribosomal protein L32|nr:50S ribosomal protein L32 [Deltaproteobacteria bacterium]MBW2143287.1 50S ribosomal protein L32 [Deltaproteobacteria bacterium]